MTETMHKRGGVPGHHEHKCCGTGPAGSEKGHAPVKADHECCQGQAPVQTASSTCGCGGSKSKEKTDHQSPT